MNRCTLGALAQWGKKPDPDGVTNAPLAPMKSSATKSRFFVSDDILQTRVLDWLIVREERKELAYPHQISGRTQRRDDRAAQRR